MKIMADEKPKEENPETPETGEEETSKNQTGEETPETPAAEKPEEKSKELQSALAQKEHYKKKYEELQQNQGQDQGQGEGENQGEETWVTSNDPVEIAKLSQTLGKYSDEETEFIMRNAESKDISGIMKAEQDPWVKDAIQAKREKVAKEQQTPEPSSPTTSNSPQDIRKSINEGTIEKDVAKKAEELEAKERREGGV